MSYKIMIVDDQSVSRQMFELYIDRSPNYEVIYSLDTAMFADTYILKAKPDLIIMDILMQDTSNGLEAAEKIKKINPQIKIIAVTSMPEVSWMEKAKAIGIESFWYKEASEESILNIIERTLAGESIYPEETPVVQLGLAKSTEFTPKEIQVLRFLTTGAVNEEIAEKMAISSNTVKTHIQHLMQKTGFKSRTQLAIQARLSGLVIEDE
ncbi:MAG: response regulator transcription factor [Clostridiales bacterium]|nr:response regulator transcription factor [Clostridiales bacterium]MDU2293402.1 response regulator transcription factor [Peptococcus niger]MDU5952825.1 response regulator transcription factor [Clostridiales bacterium]MDU7244642.1 response regulator transcription factor [Clostridiales bacterium]MDU7505566.1 response regulator transcription factor [Clostridia bacterium]